ncbi:unnamed protein product [Rhodiola kirilowii]
MTEPECDGGGGNGEAIERLSRKEKRKMLKKMKRKEKRKDVAVKEKEEEEMRINDPEEVRRMEVAEREERERAEKERMEYEERERLWMAKLMEMKKREEEEAERQMKELEQDQLEEGQDYDSDGFEYLEEGPAEIIWQGNEIIVKKNKVKVPKKKEEQTRNEEADRPTSNPLPPQWEAYTDSLNVPVFSAQQAYDNLAQQVPSFGTEQDKAHCPFHIKTGVCRFGSRCNRAHFYPDKSCTLLIKNMYSGPGLAWEQDEALEYSEEEVERSLEEFYEDVHTEFLKFGEIINFKVCRNGSAHLRGNVYVHYKFLDSALHAYYSINGRFFAGKQVKCEYIGVTRWKVAICGEYMKTRFSTCSRGTACNFIHCFRNPGGDYEWADWDKPPPKYWVKKMSALFGYTDDSVDETRKRSPSQLKDRNSQKLIMPDAGRYCHSRRSCSRDRDSSSYRSHRDHYKKKDSQEDTQRQWHKTEGRRQVGRKNSKDTPERDRMKENTRERSHSRRSSEGQIKDEGFTDIEDDADEDRSSKEIRGETHCSRESNRSRHEVEITREPRASRSRTCDFEIESNESGGLALDQATDSCRFYNGSKDEGRIRCTNWDKGRDGIKDLIQDRMEHQHKNEVGVRHTHKHQEENQNERKRRDTYRTSCKHVDQSRDVYSHRHGKETSHKLQMKRRRSSEHMKESYRYSHDHADKKKKTYITEADDNYSEEDRQHQSKSPVNVEKEAVVDVDDRWDPR